jgi:uncharacterized membrane protein
MSLRLRRFLFLCSSIVLFGAAFPWLFMFKGEIMRISISLRALGDIGGVLLTIAGVACAVGPRLRERLMSTARELDASSPSIQNRVLWGSVSLYSIIVLSHKLRAQSLISTHAYDLGFFSNICWNTAHGNWFLSSELERNFMAMHVNWILWPLAFFYKMGGDARILLVAQTAFVAATLPILWSLVRNVTGSFAAGALAVLLFVCSPYINQSVANDFHPDLWLLPCLMASLLCWRRANRIGTIGFALLAILAKEDVSVVVCAWGALLFFDKRWRWTGGVLFAASLVIFVFQIKFFIPKFLDSSQTSLLFYRYAFLGKGYAAIDPVLLIDAFGHEPTKYLRLAAYLLPVGGLTCLAPAFLFPAFISALPHLLSCAGTQLDLADIYAMPSQPFLFCGAAFGAVTLARRVGPQRIGAIVGALVAIAGIGLFASPSYFQSKNLTRMGAFNEMKALIPPNASLLAQQNLFPQFDTRRYIQIFPIGDSFPGLKKAYMLNPEFVVCDRIGNSQPFKAAVLADAIAGLERSAAYAKIFEKENFVAFRRTNEEPLQWQTRPKPIT